MTTRAITIVARADFGELGVGAQQGIDSIRRLQAEAKTASSTLQKAFEAATQSQAVSAIGPNSVGAEKARAHYEQQVDFYRHIAGDSTKSETLRAKAREKYVEISNNLEVTATKFTAQQEQERVALSRAASEKRAAQDRTMLASSLRSQEQATMQTATIAGRGEERMAGGTWKEALGKKGIIGGNLRHGLSAAGMSGAGGEIGFGLSMMAHMGLAAGGVTAGVLLVAKAYETATERAKDLVEVQLRHADAVHESQLRMRNLSTPTTSVGGEFRSAAESAEKQARDLKREMAKDAKDRGPVSGVLEAFGRMFTDPRHVNDQLDSTRAAGEKADMLKGIEAEGYRARRIEVQANADAKRRRDEDSNGQITYYSRVASLRGKDRENAQFEEESRRQISAMARKHSDETLQMSGDTTKGHEERKRTARASQVTEVQALAYELAAKRKDLEHKQGEELRKEQGSAQDSYIRATMAGYAQERALLAEKHRQEREDYRANGKDTKYLDVRQQNEAFEQSRKHAWEEEDAINAVTDRTLAAGQASEVAAQRAQALTEIERKLTRGLLDGNEALTRRVALTNQYAAEDSRASQLAVRSSRIHMAITKGIATQVDADMDEWQKAHPGGDVAGVRQSRLREMAAAQNQTPMQAYRGFKLLQDQMTAAGGQSRMDEVRVLREHLRPMMNQGVGEYMDVGSYLHKVQSDTLKKDVPQQQLEAMQDLRKEMKALNKEFQEISRKGMALKI